MILTFSAGYIANKVTQTTRKKQNTCLLTWHTINLFILTAIAIILGIFYMKSYAAWKTGNYEKFYQYSYYSSITIVAELNLEFYVDIFLLWLLNRFTKP